MSYEELTSRLKEIISLFEEGNLALDETIKLYEEGASIIKRCEGMLDEAGLRIMKVSQDRQSLEEVHIDDEQD